MNLSFGWPLLRRPLLWVSVAWITMTMFFALIMYALIVIPGPWDGAIAIKTCGNLPIVQRRDGTIWLRDHWRAYRVNNLDKLC